LANVFKLDELIREVRGQKVMLDTDLARIYGIPTFRFNEAIKRNRERFPEDFMFRLTAAQFAALTSQFAMSKKGRGGRRTLPYAFTEHGAVMAANIHNSPRAVQMSVEACPERSRMGCASISQNARSARRQTRLGPKTRIAGKRTEKTTRCS